MRIVSIILMFLLVLPAAFSQDGGKPSPKVRMTMSQDTMMIGDHVEFTVEISKDLNQEIWFPDFPDSKLTEKIEIIEQSPLDTLNRDGRDVTIAKHYMLTSFDAGIHLLTRFPLLYLDKNITDTLYVPDSIELVVKTFEIDTAKMSIYDIKRPIHTPLVFGEIKELVFWIFVGLAVIAAIIYYFIRRRRRKADYRPKINVPPHVLAIQELERLKSENLWQNGKHKLYYTRMTDILRDYLDSRYGVNAMEMTTEQTMEALAKYADCSDKVKESLRDVLVTADFAKFAKFQPSAEENESMYRNACYFVEETKVLNIEGGGENEI